jgi:hypothetical protein
MGDPRATGRRLTVVEVPPGLPGIPALFDELTGYTAVLLGHAPCPLDQVGYLALMEYATVVFARGKEIEGQILRMEMTPVRADGDRPAGDPINGPFQVPKGTPYYRFRTGPLTSFLDAAKRMADLGSRRLTEQDVLARQRYDAGETRTAGRSAWG